MTLATDIALIAADTQILHDIINNGAYQQVLTESGLVDTAAEAIRKIGNVAWGDGSFNGNVTIAGVAPQQAPDGSVNIGGGFGSFSKRVRAGDGFWADGESTNIYGAGIVIDYDGTYSRISAQGNGTGDFGSLRIDCTDGNGFRVPSIFITPTAPASVAAGTAAIGDGVGRFSGSLFSGSNFWITTGGGGIRNANVVSPGTINGISLYDTGEVYIGTKAGVIGRWYVGTDVLIDMGTQFTIHGTAPASVAANTAAIGGGDGLFANSITAQSVKITGTQILVNGVDADIAFNINYVGYNMGTTRFRSTNIYDGKNGLIARFDGATSKVTINSTSDGSLTANGRITAKAAVPASFADLAAVRTYLASILT